MPSLEILSIRRIRQAVAGTPCQAALHAQVERVQVKPTKSGSEYLELRLADAEDQLTVRVWGDSPVFPEARQLPPGALVAVEGEWASGSYGLEPRQWSLRPLLPDERAALLGGPAELRARQERDYADITRLAASLEDPRLRGLCLLFLDEHGARFRRTAAARDYHHARRGGLVEHVAQMMRAADALAAVYPATNRSLLLAGVLFHDCGKLWENCYEAEGFTMPHHEAGELLGHISLGIELVNRLWRRLMDTEGSGSAGCASLPASAAEESGEPPAESVRLHLLHLIGSHHGEHQFGSPVLPRTPEAVLLHHVDNIDAKLEMLSEAYATSTLLASNIFERRRPLPGNPVRPLPTWQPAASAAPEAGPAGLC